MINEAWRSIEEVPYCILGLSLNLKVLKIELNFKAENSTIWIQFE